MDYKIALIRGDGIGPEVVGERCKGDITPVIDTYEDHRMAMAFAPIALKLGEIRINDPQVVTKSYPRFWDDLKSVTFVIEEIN